MTDNEIIKASECCLSGKDYDTACMKCPIEPICESDDILLKYALDLINRQKAEIERLQTAVKEFAERLKEKLQWDVEFDNKLVFESDIDNLVKEMTE